MCRAKIKIKSCPRGCDRSSHRSHCFVFIFILSLILHCHARDNGTPDGRRMLEERMQKIHRDKLQMNRIATTDWREDNLYVAHSGDPWASSSRFNDTFDHARKDFELRNKKETLVRTRFKRGVIHLYNMVVCATGCNPLVYKGYGCYCGFLGSGYVIDGIDRCCKMHDWCYDATECPMFMEYFVPYYWRCYHGYKPVCAVEHGNWGASGSCAQRLCECDRSLAECLRRYPCPRTKAVCTSSPWRLVQNLFMIM